MRSSKVNVGDSGLAAQYNNLRSDAYASSILEPHQDSTPDMKLTIEAGTYYIGITKVVYAGGQTPSFTAPSANPRIDIVTADSAGTIAITQGVENASPVAPSYPANKIVICEVYHRTSETAIYDTDQGSNGYIKNDSRPTVEQAGYIADPTQMANGVVGPNQLSGTVGLLSAAMILAYGGSSAPTGWLMCDGSAVSRSTYATLFGIISTTFGAGDGSTTFNVPDLRGRVPVGKNSATFSTLGATGGEETHVLTSTEMPSHSHTFGCANQGGGDNTYVSNSTGGPRGSIQGTSSVGGGAAHNNLQPYLVVNYIIKT